MTGTIRAGQPHLDRDDLGAVLVRGSVRTVVARDTHPIAAKVRERQRPKWPMNSSISLVSTAAKHFPAATRRAVARSARPATAAARRSARPGRRARSPAAARHARAGTSPSRCGASVRPRPTRAAAARGAPSGPVRFHQPAPLRSRNYRRVGAVRTTTYTPLASGSSFGRGPSRRSTARNPRSRVGGDPRCRTSPSASPGDGLHGGPLRAPAGVRGHVSVGTRRLLRRVCYRVMGDAIRRRCW
jgi:hypothetical protein